MLVTSIFPPCREEQAKSAQLEEKAQATEKELEETKSKMADLEAELLVLKTAAEQHGKGRSRGITKSGVGGKRGAAAKGGSSGGRK